MKPIYHNMPQRSEEWFAIRSGKITASEVGEYLANGKQNATTEKAKLNLFCAKIAEMAGCEAPPRFENWAMTRGTELEPLAREAYELESGNRVEECGFVEHQSRNFGCSPDGLVGIDGGLEIKCPIPATHIKYFMDGTLPDEYRMQVHFTLAVTGRAWWDFFSFCPRLPSLLVRVERDSFTDRVSAGIHKLNTEYEAFLERYSAAYKSKKELLKERKAS